MNCLSAHTSIPNAAGEQKRDLVSDGLRGDQRLSPQALQMRFLLKPK